MTSHILPDDESYRTCTECGTDCLPEPTVVGTCTECGTDCLPEPTVVEGVGIRIAFVCAEHGVHSFIDPFEE